MRAPNGDLNGRTGDTAESTLELRVRIFTVDVQARHSILLSVIISVYVTSHGFILLMCGPSAAMLVPPAPQY